MTIKNSLPEIGKLINKNDIHPFDKSMKKLGDLIYYEGPLESIFQKDNKYYIYKWCDVNSLFNRWLVFHVNKNDLVEFFQKKINSFTLIKRSDEMYLIHFGNEDFIQNKTYKVSFNELPDDYLPSEDAMYDENFYENYARELFQELLK